MPQKAAAQEALAAEKASKYAAEQEALAVAEELQRAVDDLRTREDLISKVTLICLSGPWPTERKGRRAVCGLRLSDSRR